MTKQQQIQSILSALGWSLTTFADVVYEARYSDENGDIYGVNNDEIQKLAEKIKKQLQRPTTQQELLDSYLSVLCEHPEYQALQLDHTRLNHLHHDNLPYELEELLSQISAALDNNEVKNV
ncbi:elongation factor Ts [Photobacterium leiognathi]|uniref:elongation factor Ts n=1 Tax=Photobacterium leiognathi TaxID=553611 RepID=UPI002981F93F|nr:elongation factor Ts [Photobacterium leiognathi]